MLFLALSALYGDEVLSPASARERTEMKKVYLVKKDVSKPTCEDNWIQMNSYEFYQFMQTPEGKSRSGNFGKIEGCDSSDAVIYAECGMETAKRWRSENERLDYLREMESKKGIVTIPCQLFVCNGISDDAERPVQGGDPVEESVIRKMEAEALYRAIWMLPSTDRRVVVEICLVGDKTETELGKLMGLSRDEIHEIKRRAFRRLKKLLLSENIIPHFE